MAVRYLYGVILWSCLGALAVPLLRIPCPACLTSVRTVLSDVGLLEDWAMFIEKPAKALHLQLALLSESKTITYHTPIPPDFVDRPEGLREELFFLYQFRQHLFGAPNVFSEYLDNVCFAASGRYDGAIESAILILFYEGFGRIERRKEDWVILPVRTRRYTFKKKC